MRLRTKKKKMNHYERQAIIQKKRELAFKGDGLYEYQNATKGDLTLPKPPSNGDKRAIPPGGIFLGDSYFLTLVKSMELKLIRRITAPGQTPQPTITEKKEEPMANEKLILDQPDQVKHTGRVEHIVAPPKEEKLHETPKEGEQTDEVLLNDCPIDGVEILLD